MILQKTLLFFVLFSVSYCTYALNTLPLANGQIWEGTYLCQQKSTILNLKINEVSSKSVVSSKGITVYPVSAVFEFQTNRGIGSFLMNGAFVPSNSQLVFSPSSWIKQLRGFRMVGMQGTISADGNSYSGLINFRGCSKFKVDLSNSKHQQLSASRTNNPYVRKPQATNPFVQKPKPSNSFVQQTTPVNKSNTRDKNKVIILKQNASTDLQKMAREQDALEYIETIKKYRKINPGTPFENSELAAYLERNHHPIDRLIIKYNYESRKMRINNIQLNDRQITLALANIDGFPVAPNSSIFKLRNLQSELRQLMEAASNQALKIRKNYGEKTVPFEKQIMILKNEFLPLVTSIQKKTLEMLSSVPVSDEGMLEAINIYNWLKFHESGFIYQWKSKVFSKVGDIPPVDYILSRNEDLSIDNFTMSMAHDIQYNQSLIREIWQVIYSRKVDDSVRNKLDDKGLDGNVKLVGFLLGLPSSSLGNGLPVVDMNRADNKKKYCMFSSCSSKVVAFFSGEPSPYQQFINKAEKLVAIRNKKLNALTTLLDKLPLNYSNTVRELLTYRNNPDEVDNIINAIKLDIKDSPKPELFLISASIKNYFGGYTAATESRCPDLKQFLDPRLEGFKGRVKQEIGQNGKPTLSYYANNNPYVNGIKDGWLISSVLGCGKELELTNSAAAEAAKTQFICIMGICQ